MILDMCCFLTSSLGLAKNAISDEYGGYCGSPSLVLPTVCPLTTSKTDSKTDSKVLRIL
jgi:hypothetical protein